MTPDTIASGALPLAMLVALAAGLVSFASPCVLPLLPGFLGYVTGLGKTPLTDRGVGRIAAGAVLFVLGFSVVYVVMSIFVTSIGRALFENRVVLMRLGGLLIIALGVLFLRGGVPGADTTIGWRPKAGLAGAPVLGAVVSLSWLPCSGPALAAIQVLASAIDPSVSRAVVLTLSYCLGLGLPMIIFAIGLERFRPLSRFLSEHAIGIRRFGGGMLIVVGLLMVSGAWEQLNRLIQIYLVSNFEVPI